MKLGIWGARADNRGLASQMLEVCRAMQPVKVFGIDMLDLSPHPNDWSLYAEVLGDNSTMDVALRTAITDDVVAHWLHGLDCVYLAETEYDHQRPCSAPFYELARAAGVKTVLHANAELCKYVETPDFPRPDVLATPTNWRIETMPGAILLPFPAPDAIEPPYREKRTVAHTFLHNAGWPAANDRAGTQTVLDAIGHLRLPCMVRIRSHVALEATPNHHEDVKVSIEHKLLRDWREAYHPADVLLHPRKYGGMSLPLLEASACGIPAITLAREPERTFIDKRAQIPIASAWQRHMQGGWVDVLEGSGEDLARKMEEFISDPVLVAELSDKVSQWAQEHSWEALRPKWEQVLSP